MRETNRGCWHRKQGKGYSRHLEKVTELHQTKQELKKRDEPLGGSTEATSSASSAKTTANPLANRSVSQKACEEVYRGLTLPNANQYGSGGTKDRDCRW